MNYKYDILTYITNRVYEVPNPNVPIFTDTSTLNQSLDENIKTLLDVNSYEYKGYLFDEETQTIMIYGTYGTNNDLGFMYLVEDNLATIKMITKFSTGTDLFSLIDIKKDEDGYLYGISKNSDGTMRILLLNNVFVKVNNQYVLKLRASYIVPNSNNYQVVNKSTFWNQISPVIQKVPGEATYFFSVRYIGTNNEIVIRFSINVGEDNEWVTIDTGRYITSYSMLIEKIEDKVRLHYYSAEYNGSTTRIVREHIIENDVMTQTRIIATNQNIDYIKAVSTNEIYVCGKEEVTNYSIIQKIVDTKLITIKNFENSNTIKMEYANNIVSFKVRNSSQSKSYIGIVVDDDISFSNSVTDDGTDYYFFLMYSYNLLSYYIALPSDKTLRYYLDYNPLNFNGNKYNAYNETVPVKGRLYSDSILVFARNLYNTTLLGATSTSTLQVPNTLLNNTELTQMELLGATNITISLKSTDITKNVYETLYINFIRTFSVIDEDTNVKYPNTASYINQNINIGTEQNSKDTSVGKVQIVYSNEIITQNISWWKVLTHYETQFTIDATNEVPTIRFMSNDLSTVYLEKELDVQVGSYYKVTQKLRIE